MASINILSKLSYKETVVGILLDQNDRKNRVKKYLDDLVVRWPNIKIEVDKVWTSKKSEFDALTDASSYDEWQDFFNAFHHENNIINLIINETKNEIDKLLLPNDTDNPVVKELKETTQLEEHKKGLDIVLKDKDGGLAWYVFLINILKQTYLIDLPEYIDKHLKDFEVPVYLTDLGEDWKTIKNEIYSNIYSGFTKVEEEKDLGLFKTNLENQIFKIDDLIDSVKIKKVKEQNKEWTDTFPNKTAPEIKKELDELKNKPTPPVDENTDLGLDEDTPTNQSKKKLITEIKRLVQLKGLKVKFVNDKDKIPEKIVDKTLTLLLNQTDNGGDFSPNLVLWSLAQELTHYETNMANKLLPWWKELEIEKTWLKDNLSVEYQKDYIQLLNPSTFPTDKLDINKVLVIDLEKKDGYVDSSFSVNKLLVDKSWQIIKDKALEVGIRAVINYSSDWTITINHEVNDKELERLMIETPLRVEIDYLKQEKGKLPTTDNYDKVVRQNKEYDYYLYNLTDKDKYTEIKEKINKIVI